MNFTSIGIWVTWLQVSVRDDDPQIPNSWVMFNLDNYKAIYLQLASISWFMEYLWKISGIWWFSMTMTQKPMDWNYLQYIFGLRKGISPQDMTLYATVPPFQDLDFSMDRMNVTSMMRKRNYCMRQNPWWIGSEVAIVIWYDMTLVGGFAIFPRYWEQ